MYTIGAWEHKLIQFVGVALKPFRSFNSKGATVQNWKYQNIVSFFIIIIYLFIYIYINESNFCTIL